MSTKKLSIFCLLALVSSAACAFAKPALAKVAPPKVNTPAGTPVSVFSFMTPAEIADVQNRTEKLDVSASVQKFLDYLRSSAKGRGHMPAGTYLCKSPVVQQTATWVEGDGCHNPGGEIDGITVIKGVHRGAAVWSMQKAHACRLADLTIYGDEKVTPKTGLLLGRKGYYSAGIHRFDRIHVDGYYTKASIYSIASESNVWYNCTSLLRGGGGLYCLYSAQGDSLGVDSSLTGSSNLDNNFYRFETISLIDDENSSSIFIDGGAGTGSWSFFGGYLIQKAGSYVTLRSGAVDGQDTLGSIVFHGMGGELFQGGAPRQGFNLIGTQSLRGLSITGSRFQFKDGDTAARIIKQAPTLTLKQPNIFIQDEKAIPSEFYFDKVIDGFVSCGAQSYTAPTLLNAWNNAYASANDKMQPGYLRRPDGTIALTGEISEGAISSIAFTLPPGYRPAKETRFPVVSNNLFGSITVTPEGNVIPQAGSSQWVSLDGITFKSN